MTTLGDLESQIAALQNKADYVDYGSDFLRFGKDVSSPATTAIVVCLVDGTYNGENFASGDILFGDNTTGEDNIVYKSGVWQVRYGNNNMVTFGSTGIRIVQGGLALKQTTLSVSAGANDLTENGDFLTSSNLIINASAGAFSINSLVKPFNLGLVVYLKNSTADTMTIVDGGVPLNADYWSITTQSGADVVIAGPGMAQLIGNELDGCWELVNPLA